MNIKIDGVDSVKKLIANIGGELQEADRLSQNAMAYEIWRAEKEQMQSDLDRPTPWSVNSIRYKKHGPDDGFGDAPNTKGAAVYMANAFRAGSRVGPDEWLGVQIVGGLTAGPRRSERVLNTYGWMRRDYVWVPAVGCPVDAYGNVRGSAISDMLTNLGANPYGQKKDISKTEVKYVLIGDPGKEEGVWRKVGKEWVPFIWFVPRAQYRARFDFYGRADREIITKFNDIWGKYVDIAISKLI